MKNFQNLIITCFLFLIVPLLAYSQNPSHVTFKFKIKEKCSTSAGVYTSKGILLRTLWSNKQFSSGEHIEIWDGRDDNGEIVSKENCQIKVLTNKVRYEYDGVIGNTSQLLADTTEHQGLEPIQDMIIIDTVAYFVTGYSEGRTVTYYMSTSNPQKRYPLFSKGAYVVNMTTDGSTIYYSGYDYNNTFVFAMNLTDRSEKIFSTGTIFKTKFSRTYSSAINVLMDNADGSITGLAVQKEGNYLFVARKSLNRIDVLNKSTGSLVKTLMLSQPGRMSCIDDNIWVITKGQVVKYKVNNDGTFSSAITKLMDLSEPLSISVQSHILLVNDGGSSQQVKAFNSTNGSLLWIRGTQGGYTKGASVTNDKLYLGDDKFNDSLRFRTFSALGPDGSLWVGDVGNNRVQHYAGDGRIVNTILYRPKSYSCRVDRNNPTRVFSDYLEYAIDYSKPLKTGWKLVRNWGAFVRVSEDDKYLRLRSIATLSNGRTYGIVANEIVELVSDTIRHTGVRVSLYSQLYGDGSLRRISRYTVGKPNQWHCKNLKGFDSGNNPLYYSEQLKASSSNVTEYTPGYRGSSTVLRSGERTNSGKYVVLDYSKVSSGFHLGAVQEGTTGWNWLTAKSTFKEYNGDYPEDGAFDIGNGVKNAGSSAIVLGDNIFWGYYGEFWKNSQVNKWTHVYENGLMVGVFGWAGNDEDPIGDAGNAFAGNIVHDPNDSTVAYLYHNDEGHHGGVHRWKISNLNSIETQAAIIDTQIKKQSEGMDLLDGLKNNSVLSSGRYGWTRTPDGEDLTNMYSKYWSAKTSVMSYASLDLYIRYRQEAGVSTISRDLGDNANVDSWRVWGEINWIGNQENHLNDGGSYFDILDNSGKIISRVYNLFGAECQLIGNNSIILKDTQRKVRKYTSHYEPIDISVSQNKAMIRYADLPVITTSIFDVTADWRNPKTLRLYFFSKTRSADRIIDLRDFKFSIKATPTSIISAPTVIAIDDTTNTLSASHPLGVSEILVSENDGPFVPYEGIIHVGTDAKPKGYWKFKVKATEEHKESPVLESPAFSLNFLSSTAPLLIADDQADTLSASHGLGTSAILVSENGGSFKPYTGTIIVGNVARHTGYWKFKIKAGVGRNESEIVESSAFSETKTPTAPTLLADDILNTITAIHSLGDTEILVSTDGGNFKPYTGIIYVGNNDRIPGFYKFKTRSAPNRNESPVAESPLFTIPFTPVAPALFSNDTTNVLIAQHSLGWSEIVVSENNGEFLPYVGQINVGNIQRPSGYWRFKVKQLLPTRNESKIVYSPAFTLTSTPDAPTLKFDDLKNTLSASHVLGNSQILVSVNSGAFKAYSGQILVGNVVKPEGYWKFKIKAIVPTRLESAVAKSPAFTLTTTPTAPTIKGDDIANTLTVTHALGQSEIEVSEDGGDYKPLNGTIIVGNVFRQEGYWRFKIKSVYPTRNESDIVKSPEFTFTESPAPPSLRYDDVANTLSASHPLGISQIVVSENNGSFKDYTGQIIVGNVGRRKGYWKFKIKEIVPIRIESEVIQSPEFTLTTTPSAPIITGDDWSNTLTASHELGKTEILVSENGGPYVEYTGPINVGNNARISGYWKFKIKGVVPTRNESAVVKSPSYTVTTTPGAPTVLYDDVANTIVATHSLGNANIVVSEKNGAYQPYDGQILVGNVARAAGYWKFKIKELIPTRTESGVVTSPEFTYTSTPEPPTIAWDDENDIVSASHPLGNSEILVSENYGTYGPYTGPIQVGNIARASGYWRFKIKGIVPTRNESEVAKSPAFTYSKTPVAPKVTADDYDNTLSVSHSLGASEIVVSVNNGAYKAYTGEINVGNVARPAGYWKFKIEALAPNRYESAVVSSPAFTVTVTPDAPGIKADDVENTLSVSHLLGMSEILVSEANGPYEPYTGGIDVGNVTRPAGYWKFKVKSVYPTRNESEVVNSPAFTLTLAALPPTISADDFGNTLSVSHALGNSEILVSVNNSSFKEYKGTINVGNSVREKGYWKFKIKAALPLRDESEVVSSPAFTVASTPVAPTLKIDDRANTLTATHTLGVEEILVSEDDGSFKPYDGQIVVGNKMRPEGYWKFKTRAVVPSRNESAITLSPAFTTTPASPTLKANFSKNTLNATHELGLTEILVSVDNGAYKQYLGQIFVGPAARPAGYWKFKIKAAEGRSESLTISSPAFADNAKAAVENYTPNAPELIVNDTTNILLATSPLGVSEILVSTNDSAYQVRTTAINVGNVARPAGYYKFKIRAIEGRNESDVVESPAFTTTPGAPVITANDTYNTITIYHNLGPSELMVSENDQPYQPYAGKILVGDVHRSAGYWKFKVKAAEGRSESAVVASPEFTTRKMSARRMVKATGSDSASSGRYLQSGINLDSIKALNGAINLVATSKSVKVYPNPVVGNTFNITMDGFPDGKYAISLISNGGQVVEQQMVYHTAKQANKQLTITKNIGKGFYTLLISGSNAQVSRTIIKN